MPDEGSSKKISVGSPHNAMAVLSFLLLPPLKKIKVYRESATELKCKGCTKFSFVTTTEKEEKAFLFYKCFKKLI